MFKAGNSRKRIPEPCTEVDAQPSRHRKEALPLKGVVVCLSGLTAAYKVKLHQLVDDLGGAFTRHLDTSQNTHLVATSPHGEKYFTAKACPRIQIVTPEWIEECANTGVRAREENYLTLKENAVPELTLEKSLDLILALGERSKLFASCRFYPIGFDNDSGELLKLSKLIRRGMGTNYWELNEVITHIIVKDKSDDVLREAARTVTLHHPNGPAYVSPRWIVASWNTQELQPPQKFEPQYERQVSKSANPKKLSARRVSTGLFQGTIFCIIRIAPPDGCIDWDSEELKSSISTHGGQMLSSKLLESLRTDKINIDAQRRTLYMISWGGYTPLHATLNPILAHIKKEDLCSVVPVTPIWLKTAITEQKIVIPKRRPLLFQPQPWPFSTLPESTIVALTGFSGSERTGIILLIETLGATYTANLKPQNTHLICKEAEGPKFDKAIEWKLHVVNVEWLYHVARYGISEKVGGGETKFSLKVDDDTTSRGNNKLDGEMELSLSHTEVSETQAGPSQD